MTDEAAAGFTATQRQRLRELGLDEGATDQTFADAAAREARFRELERSAAAEGRRRLAELRERRRAPALSELCTTLRSALLAAGCVEVVTPHIISADALAKMGIAADDPLADQVFWLDRSHCLRPMLAPNLYTLMRRLGRHWRRPFAIFEIGTCFRRDSRGSRHLNEFTMLNLVELGRSSAESEARLRELAALVLTAAGIADYEFQTVPSGVYGDTTDVVVDGLEVCSAALGPHPLDDAWGIVEPWVGLGFGVERLIVARDGYRNIERVGRSLSYLDGVRLSV